MLRSLLGLAVGLACVASAPAMAASPAKPNQCFRSQDYEGFRPIDEHGFYIRVRVNEFYKIEVEGSCPELLYPDARLITVVRGSDEICGPIDWDLKVGQSPPDIPVACIVKSQTRLTKDEAAAIPPKQKP
jgi:hypothetical protein